MCSYTKIEDYWYAKYIHERVLYSFATIYIFFLVLLRSRKFTNFINSVQSEGYSSSVAVDAMYEEYVRMIDYAMILHKPSVKLKRYSNRMSLSNGSLENIKAALNSNKPIIFASSNFSLFYLMTFCKEFELVEDITFIKANDSKMRRELDQKLSKYSGVNIESIPFNVTNDNFKETVAILRILQNNKHIGCNLDIIQNNLKHTMVDFLDKKMVAPKSIFNLAVVGGAIIVPVMIVRNKNTYQLVIEKHLSSSVEKTSKKTIEKEIHEIAQEYYRVVEERIKNDPGKWSNWHNLKYVRVNL